MRPRDSYDSQGRRAYKKVTTNGSVTLHQRYIYRGYLQIACCDLTRTAHPCLWLITWDPTQTVATRPLAIRKDGSWYAYGWDLTKNICEVYLNNGYIGAAYKYEPYGKVSFSGNITQPIQFSSEYNDEELGLVYYINRYYLCDNGCWNSYDNMILAPNYNFTLNNPIMNMDFLGNVTITESDDLQKIKVDASKNKNCLYVVFYYKDDLTAYWSRGKDNKSCSHVALYTANQENPIGFNPTSCSRNWARVYHETRTDIYAVLRCCAKCNNIKLVNEYLKANVNERYMYYYDTNGKVDKSRRTFWYFNGPNCATFAANVTMLYFGRVVHIPWIATFLNPKKYFLDYDNKSYAERPAQVLEGLRKDKECTLIIDNIATVRKALEGIE